MDATTNPTYALLALLRLLAVLLSDTPHCLTLLHAL